MRFEIRGGGIAAILFAVALLSGAVFVLGLLAGYDVGREAQIDSAQVATAYPMQPPPNANSSADGVSPAPSPAASVAALDSGEASNSIPAAPAASPPRPKQIRPAAAASGQSPHQRIASANVPPSAPARAPAPPPVEQAAPAPPEAAPPDEASAPPETTPPQVSPAHTAAVEPPAPPRIRRKPFNIQIQAAMDLNGASQMMRRLQQLGYQPHLVPTDIDGQRWYKVEVGPYATQDEAASAESQLRQKYNATYGGGGQPAQPADSDSE